MSFCVAHGHDVEVFGDSLNYILTFISSLVYRYILSIDAANCAAREYHRNVIRHGHKVGIYALARLRIAQFYAL